MEYLILLFIVLAQAGCGIFTKLYNIKTGNRSAFVYSGIASLVAAIFFLITSKKPEFTPAFLGYSAGFAIAYATSLICTAMAVRYGPIALTTLMTSLALMIPTLYGIICLKESVGISLILGLLMLVLSLCLINLKKDNEKVSPKWALFAGLAFLGNGMCSTIQKMEQVSFNGTYKNEFMIVALLMVSAVAFIIAFATEKKEIYYCVKKGALYTILYGISNGILNLLVMVLGGIMPASIMFPLISAFGIIGSFLIGRFMFKEKLNPMQLAGLFAGIVSIVFFNLVV